MKLFSLRRCVTLLQPSSTSGFLGSVEVSVVIYFLCAGERKSLFLNFACLERVCLSSVTLIPITSRLGLFSQL